jgi:hypothetical protein
MEPELAVDSAADARSCRGKAILLYFVSKGVRPSSSYGERMGRRRRGIEHTSD